MIHPDDEKAKQEFDAFVEALKAAKPIPEHEARIHYRLHQREVLLALLAEGHTPKEIKRDHPNLDWTLQEIELLTQGIQ